MNHLEYVILFAVLLGICGKVFKPQTPEAYAALAARRPVALFSRLAPFWKLCGSLGIDPIKVAEALFQIITGRVAPVEDKK